MEKINVTGRALQLVAGTIVRLADKQAAPRIHNLKPLKDGVFEVVNPVEFKVGEVVEVQLGTGGLTEQVLKSRARELLAEQPAALRHRRAQAEAGR